MSETMTACNVIPFPRPMIAPQPVGTIYQQWWREHWLFYAYRDGAWLALSEDQADEMKRSGYACTTIRPR